jgi:hypothetical protein
MESCAYACPDGILDIEGVLNLDTSWRWAESVTPRPLYTEENILGTYWDGERGDPQSGPDSLEKKNNFALPGIKPN